MTEFITRTNNISHTIFKMFSGYFLNNDETLCNAFNVPIQLDFDKNFHKTHIKHILLLTRISAHLQLNLMQDQFLNFNI